MPISSSHHDLFHQSNAADKISLFQSLLESQDLSADEATALVKSIHTELEQPEGHDRSVYESYVHMMEDLNHNMSEVHQQVVASWQQPRHMTASLESDTEFIEEEINEKAEIK